jgi:hypothetical protein
MDLGQVKDIATIVAAGAAVVAAMVGFINRRRINTIEVKIDGRMDELLNLTRSGARAEGVTQGEQDQRDRTSGGES